MPQDLFANSIVSVAVPLPLRQTFDFLLPLELGPVAVGGRVKVPFGKRKLIGFITAIKTHSDYPVARLKPVMEVIDSSSLFDLHLWSTLQWLTSYYLAPMGEVLAAAIPVKLRQGAVVKPAGQKSWQLSSFGEKANLDTLSRAPLQMAIVERFRHDGCLSAENFKFESGSWRQAVKALIAKKWLKESEQVPRLTVSTLAKGLQAGFELNAEQNSAVSELTNAVDSNVFSCSLLHGVTGSGKTEVYFAVIQQVIDRGQQVLLLVPEIGLTPQLIDRVNATFSCPVTIMHSALNDSERHRAWWHSRQGEAKIVIGTRSAVFCAFSDLGLIVVDEEHDGSFKQHDGVRYNARDVAVYLAKKCNIPIILGSATPSLESYANAESGRYQKLVLSERATKVALPQVKLVDSSRIPCKDGLSAPMIEAISNTLQHQKQVMLFINRRGYAPVLYCKSCTASASCHRCDSNLTLHRRGSRQTESKQSIESVRCHHCGYEGRVHHVCKDCGESELVEVGEGTQRVEESLIRRFPRARVLRIDRDSSRRKGELTQLLEQARSGSADILVGTQLITKGHDFPNVALVGILGVDQGLYSIDYRASEALFQQVLQVSGRAGRRDSVGQVLIQTAFPQNAFFQYVGQHDFDGFANSLMSERLAAAYPPFGFFALLRAESTHKDKALRFLRQVKTQLGVQGNIEEGVRVMDPIPAPLERRAGKHRAQLLICSNRRSSLNGRLMAWLNHLETDPPTRKLAASVRWSLDIDPYDHF